MPATVMKLEPLYLPLAAMPWLELRDARGWVKPQLVSVAGETWLTVSLPVKPGELGKLGTGWKHASDYPFRPTT